MRIFLTLVGLLTAFVSPVYAQTDPPPAKLLDVVDILQRIIKLLAPAAGIAFFVMLLVGGFQFVTSGGDPKAAGQARSTLTMAVIGIILVVASWLILKLIAGLTGVDVTTVEIPK
ncbi:hypothetical protein A2697_04930 [Candidatus Curtissbacteria bacterium RIFCSPHIGHO2_01_FULL_41_44]|uniref:Uncharacterized protein n=1 Tax=Candidatus Curtissbacteria bacterium RIFCSPLOWO2_01_FULL_42_50 TaxID=1797730 RepID=A0A1F5H5Z2_9BACT|nr:MAG: hypothetical protein A3C33_00380 [Candidatus Curtissbacteria bacterium RIFCSPHIGHO2_02_FULL_42_58]OGD93988.1 MAG: hypothetical protein A2697_04930 [Candidatus Curtissbacteria bacterium RIFCSPHIGHO2_01_FULL_41_44]OGD97594.1 MAG: hypothetical protein A3E71_05235 [Candidatus Curtissbacteria bacterium RIFCSPHIGHO2_12_FULL_42_33]OGD99586.1 MAG: hypothetical protein A3B54_02440 [Candidatus Curtissbacteria bacterium RIFCSPLOWO2_01_FULL_42_50]OGE02566.1 MAG: hypothetical protein A3G16_03490 [Ca